MTSLPVTFGHVTSFPVTWRSPPASYSPYELKRTQNSTYTPSTATSKWLPIKRRDFRVTSGRVRSRDVISCHVTTTCEFLPCRSSNVPKIRLIRLLRPLPGEIRRNDVTSGSVPVTWSHVTSFPVTWRPPLASYSPVRAQTYQN